MKSNRLRFVFPSSILKTRAPDEMFADQVSAFQGEGFEVSLVSIEALQAGEARITPPPAQGETVVYRGWMLEARDYEQLTSIITASGALALTSTREYLLTHHLPNWYPLLQDLTPETRVFPPDVDLVSALAGLGWDRFFLKDYVKSVKTAIGSIIDSPAKAEAVVSEMKKFRGTIEGGFCVRRVEDFLPDTELRFFVIQGRPYAADAEREIPGIVHQVAERIPSRFFSVDVVTRRDGTLRVVEVGDGQVSDIVGWTPERLVAVWKRAQNP